MTTPDTAPNIRSIKRREEFYISDSGSTSIFLVEDTLYKVHQYFLARESPAFQTMFTCPHPVEGQDGESDEKPIHLAGVSCSQFEALLDFFYNGMFMRERDKSKYNGPKGNPQTLYDLLSISLRYEFNRVTREVVARIDECADNADPVMKICLGLAHDSLRYWVQPAYNAIIKRDSFLTHDEIVRLGAGRTAIVGAMREKEIRDHRSGNVFGKIQPLQVPPNFYSV